MTEKCRQAVLTFVNCSEKISRAVEALNKNQHIWSIEKMKTTERICESLAKQREEARKNIFNEEEVFTQEESEWVYEELKPYIKTNE